MTEALRWVLFGDWTAEELDHYSFPQGGKGTCFLA